MVSPTSGTILSPRGVPSAPSDPEATQLQGASSDFEALLLRQLVVAMRKTIPESSTSAASSKLYDHFLEDGLSQHLADVGGIGLSDLLDMREKTGGNSDL